MKYRLFTLFIGFLCCFGVHAQNNLSKLEQDLKNFFANYQTVYANIGDCKLNNLEVNPSEKRIIITTNPNFGYQPFTPENTAAIYRSVKQLVPHEFRKFKVIIYADKKPIEELVPNSLRRKKDETRLWQDIDYKGEPWTVNVSRPYRAEKGLEGRHLTLWQSHGYYYKNDQDIWKWQRPRLFCTTEDLFTQTFVVPYIIPMLENAGAVVYTPRERDWQRHEVIVDNDVNTPGSIYQEVKSRKSKWRTSPKVGFAHKRKVYTDKQNPFEEGSARIANTEKKAEKAFAQWIPNIPQTGSYAVYVSYQTLTHSVSDAKYLVFHKGGVTEFKVNQQMGGDTWVYLGTFEFDKGTNDYGMVVLSNESKQQGVITADAVRFGGGMGNIVRGGRTSGLPRYLEGARYAAQWAGMPYEVYSHSQGEVDYNDDINARSKVLNYLSGGSVYNPTENGLQVPFELSMGLHSDAGFSRTDELVGSLGIYTTDFNEGKLNTGISRYASRDLADMMLTGLQRDISHQFSLNWARRSMWNRNYSETRLPAVPSMILELLSHQNFADMKLGHDPHFKFTVGRAVYKAILKYLAEMHQVDYEVQPLPVKNFAIELGKKNTFHLQWQPVSDPLEPTAKAKKYIVYTRLGNGGFDNGTLVSNNEYTFQAEPGLVYSFKVTAVNKGGESFPSEILSAYHAPNSRQTILIVNAFNRLSGPAIYENSKQQGFLLDQDPGVPYRCTPAYCGPQLGFDRSHIGSEAKDGLGYSDQSWEGILVAGNTFDYPFVHGKAIQGSKGYSFVSCSESAILEKDIHLDDYPIVDILRGTETTPFDATWQQLLAHYCTQGGNLILSGANLGSSMNGPAYLPFTEQVLNFTFGGSIPVQQEGTIFGANTRFSIPRRANEATYAVPSPDCLMPKGNAQSMFIYEPGNYSAGIAFRGKHKSFILGFPFESIQGNQERIRIMRAMLHFFETEKRK